jgi:hypothetical protein
MIQFRFAITLVLVTGSVAFGQPGGRRMGMPPGGPGGPGDFAFVRPEFGLAGKLVKGAPYAAQAVTQYNQTLADGNHIQRTTTASVARDSEGRTRTERSVGAIGQMTGSGGSLKATFINDPVAGTSYVLDANRHTARQMPAMTNRRHQEQAGVQGAGGSSRSGTESARAGMRQRAMAGLKTEDLGTQVIDGLAVQGKRVSHTITAAQASSERNIEVVTETWYSPELQMVVMSKTSDPRFGESVYKLTNISRAEPDPALFKVPSDYQLQQGRPGRNDQ